MDHFVYQIEEDACALACFQMILMNETGDRKYRYARLSKHPPHSLEDLEIGARRYGCALSFFRAERKEIDYPWNKKQGFLVTIAKNKSSHMLYVKKLSKRNVIYFDPSEGKRKMSRDEFEHIWTGIFGILEIKKNRTVPKKITLFSYQEALRLFLLPLISDASLFCGFYFFYGGGNFLTPILCFLLFGIFSIFHHLFALKTNTKLDRRYLSLLPFDEKERLMDTYEKYHKYKSFKISRFPRAFVSFLAGIAFTLLVSLNNPFFLLPVSILLSSYFLLSRLILVRYKSKKEKLLALEKTLRESKEKETMQRTIIKIGTLSSSYALQIEYSRIFISVLALASNIFSLLFASEVTLNFYLFHLFSLIAVFLLFKDGFDLILGKKEFLVAKGNFIEFFSREGD